MRHIITMALILGVIIGYFVGLAVGTSSTEPRPVMSPSVIRLVECETEDSSNCYRLDGGQNSVGRAFVNIDGVLYVKEGDH